MKNMSRLPGNTGTGHRGMKMEILRQLLDKVLDENFLRATISGKRHGDIAEKVKIRPVMLKGTLYFQTAVSDGKREYHKNYQKEELLAIQNYIQCEAHNELLSTGLKSKKYLEQ